MSEPETPGVTQALAAAQTIRETTKWLTTSFAAVGAAILAGTQLTRIGTTDWLHFWLALTGLSVALIAIMIALQITTDLLLPKHISLASLGNDDDNKPEVVDIIREGLGKPQATLANLREELYEALNNPDTSEDELKAILDLTREVVAVAALLKLRDDFKTARAKLIKWAFLAAAGIVLFACASATSTVEAPAIAPVANINLGFSTGKPSRVDHFLSQIGRPIGPFQTGQKDCLEDSPRGSACAKASESLRMSELCNSPEVKEALNELTKDQANVLLVVGAADKFELRSPLRQIYGSNQGLAQARAEGVLNCFSILSFNHLSIALLRGPSVDGADKSSSNTAGDRTVTVYADKAVAEDFP
jgi:hypothetical protein